MSTKVIKNQYVFTEEMDNENLLKGNDILIISDNPFEEMNGKLKRYIDDLLYNIRTNYYNEEEIKETIYVAFREEKENGISEYKIKIKIPANIDKTIDEYELPNCDAPIDIYNNELHMFPAKIIIFFDILNKSDFNIRLCNFQQVENKVIYFDTLSNRKFLLKKYIKIFYLFINYCKSSLLILFINHSDWMINN